MPASPASPPRQIGPTVWMTCPAGRRYPRVSRALPGGQPPSVRQLASSSGPAARWIAPSTPPPPSSEVLAALTIASTVSRVMSPNSIRIRSRGISSLAIARPVEKQERPSPLSGRSNWPPRMRSSADLLAEIAAEQLLVEDDAVAVIKGDLARLVGIGQSASFRQRLFAAGEAGARFAFSFLGHDPTLFRRMDSIDMASQHDPSRECDGFPLKTWPEIWRISDMPNSMASARQHGGAMPRSQILREARRRSTQIAARPLKKTGPALADPGKYAGGKPATGRLCRTGPEFKGEGPELAHMPHLCDMVENAL